MTTRIDPPIGASVLVCRTVVGTVPNRLLWQLAWHGACGPGYRWQMGSSVVAYQEPALRGRPDCGPRFGQIAVYRALVGAVQAAVLGTVPAVAVVLKLVVMPG